MSDRDDALHEERDWTEPDRDLRRTRTGGAHGHACGDSAALAPAGRHRALRCDGAPRVSTRNPSVLPAARARAHRRPCTTSAAALRSARQRCHGTPVRSTLRFDPTTRSGGVGNPIGPRRSNPADHCPPTATPPRAAAVRLLVPGASRAGHARGTATSQRVLRGSHPGRRPGAPASRPARHRLAPGAVPGDVRADQRRAVPRGAPPGRTRGPHQGGAEGPLQDRCDGQGRRRQDDGLGDASDRSSPSYARTTAWWRSTPTPRSASSAAASTPRRWAPTGSSHPTNTSRRSPTSAAGSATMRPVCSCWPARRARRADGCSTRRSTGRPPRGWTATSPSRSSTAVRRWTRPSRRRCCATSTR